MTTKEPGEKKQPEDKAAPKAEKPKAEAAAEPKAEAPPPKPPKAEETEAAPPATEPPPSTAAEPPPPPPPLIAEERRDFWDTATTYLKKAKDEVVRSSRIGKLRLDIARVKKQRKDLFAELGEKTYELLSTESLSAEALEEITVSVDEKNALIAAKEAEIEAVAAEEAEAEEAKETEEAKAKESG